MALMSPKSERCYCEPAGRDMCGAPPEAESTDVATLRQALIREAQGHRRAELRATMQTEINKLALDLLVREPDTEGFFGALAKTVVEESESHTCAVWLIDQESQAAGLWLAYVKDRLFTPAQGLAPVCPKAGAFPCEALAAHLYQFREGWTQTVEYAGDDPRLPEAVRAFSSSHEWREIVATPLLLGDRTLGWMTVCNVPVAEQRDNRWWRVVMIEAVARQAALALHHSQVVEQSRIEERRKAILEERNRLARDIHDHLAQGFAAILMQLQGATRDKASVPPALAASLDTAVELARTHLSEARRSVGALRPHVTSDEDVAAALKRIAELSQRTAGVPIDLELDDLPRFGDGVEREILAIAQEALTNAVRHSRAQRIRIRASATPSVGLRLSVADDGRGMPKDTDPGGFGLISMQERADKIGASLTIVTAPRNGTEVVLAWEPTAVPTQVHAIA
jgi:signal transduction histidine kinase